MTSLRHHGGDKWSIRAYVGTNPLTGQPRRRSVSFRANGLRAAQRMADELSEQLEAERDQATATAARDKLTAVLAGWGGDDLLEHLAEHRYEVVPIHHARIVD